MSRILLEPWQNVVATGQAQLTTSRIWPNTLEFISTILGAITTASGLVTTYAPTLAQITNIQVRLGNKVIWFIGASGLTLGSATSITAPDIAFINYYERRYSSLVAANQVPEITLPFANYLARTPKQQYLGAIDMGQNQVQQLTILLTTSGATSPLLQSYAEVAPPKQMDAASNLLFRAILQTPIAPSAATSITTPFLVNYGQSGGALLRRFYTISVLPIGLELKRDGLDIWEQIYAGVMGLMANEQSVNHQYMGSFNPTAGAQANNYAGMVYDAIEDNIEAKALTSVRSDSQGNISIIPQQVNIAHSAAGSYNSYADVLANLNGL